jgi:hypothetical protein
LSGCSTSVKFNREEFEQKKKGVVFFKAKDQGVNEGVVLKSLLSDNPILEDGCDNNKKFYEGDILRCPHKFIILEPGIYYLNQINLKSSYDTLMFYPGPGLKNGKFKYGAFEVKGGEVLAIGLLEIDSKQGKYKLIDNFIEIKQDLEKSDYPELVPKLKRGKFFMPGSTVIFKDGKYILNDKEKNEKDFLIQKVCTKGVLNMEFCKPVSNSK